MHAAALNGMWVASAGVNHPPVVAAGPSASERDGGAPPGVNSFARLGTDIHAVA